MRLATDPPSPYVLDRRPESKADALITVTMWKMIIGQSIYQLVVTFVLNFAGQSIFPWDEEHMETVVFNTFVFMQIFNQYKYVSPSRFSLMKKCLPIPALAALITSSTSWKVFGVTNGSSVSKSL